MNKRQIYKEMRDHHIYATLNEAYLFNRQSKNIVDIAYRMYLFEIDVPISRKYKKVIKRRLRRKWLKVQRNGLNFVPNGNYYRIGYHFWKSLKEKDIEAFEEFKDRSKYFVKGNPYECEL